MLSILPNQEKRRVNDNIVQEFRNAKKKLKVTNNNNAFRNAMIFIGSVYPPNKDILEHVSLPSMTAHELKAIVRYSIPRIYSIWQKTKFIAGVLICYPDLLLKEFLPHLDSVGNIVGDDKVIRLVEKNLKIIEGTMISQYKLSERIANKVFTKVENIKKFAKCSYTVKKLILMIDPDYISGDAFELVKKLVLKERLKGG